MIFGVDGTGPFGDKEYAASLKGSFVNQLCGLRRAGGHYWRGPDAIDTFLSGPAPRVVAEVIRHAVVPKAAPPTVTWGGTLAPVVTYPTSSEPLKNLADKVFLTGYSRGAATVLDVAVILKDYGIPVEAIFLFDSVTRSPWLSGAVVPSNVKHCYHAIREDSSRSRVSFGHSPAHPAAGVHFVSRHFLTTHAGMGGTPWGKAGLVKPAPKGAWPSTMPPVGAMGTTGIGYTPPPSPQEIAAGMVRDNPGRYADKLYEGIPDWDFTNVTVAQERLGMDRVRDWMWGFVRHHGLHD